MGVQNDVTEFARLDGDTGERDRLCGFHRHRDMAQIIRRSHNSPAPTWSWNSSASLTYPRRVSTERWRLSAILRAGGTRRQSPRAL